VEDKEQPFRAWQGRSVLVTGASGFLGNALVLRLTREGARVSVVNRDPYDLGLPYFAEQTCALVERVITGDLCDFRVCQRAVVETKPEVLFHLAAVTQVGWCRDMPLQAIETHVLGTGNLLEACRVTPTAMPSAIVVASTDKVYGKHPASAMPLDDASPFLPEHPYDVSKASADMIARCYGVYYGLPLAVTRCGNIYGPGDTNWDRLIPGILRSFLLHEAPVIRSDGTQVREYNYVGDIVAAYLALTEGILSGTAEPGSAWTISNGTPFTVLEVVTRCAETLRAWLGLKTLPPVVLGGAQDETPMMTLDFRRFAERFGWVPWDTDLSGLLNTATWVERWLERHGGTL
jgi:CDP-glucose 4,6-dehydratase